MAPVALLGMLLTALFVVSSLLELSPSPAGNETWGAWWSRKSLLGKTWTIFAWAAVLTIVALVAYEIIHQFAGKAVQ
jgi:hypothetical protein